MKDFVISVNNTALYISLGVIWLLSIVTLFTSGFLPARGIFVAGTLTLCIVSGFWFVQLAIYEELRKLPPTKAKLFGSALVESNVSDTETSRREIHEAK